MYVFLSKSAVFVKMGIFVKTYVFRWVFCRNMYFCHYVRFCQNVFVSSEWAILVKMYGFGQIYICWAKSFFVVKMLFCTNVRFCQMTTLCYFLRYCAILCGSVRFWQKVHFSSYCSKMWSFLFLFFLNFGPFYICSSYICAYYFCSSYFCRFLHLVFLFLRILYLSLPILGLPIFGLPMFALPIFVTSYIWSSYFWSSYFRSFLYLSLPIFGLPIFGFPIFALPIFVTSYIWSSYFWSSYVCVPINASSYNCSFLGPVLPVKWGGTHLHIHPFLSRGKNRYWVMLGTCGNTIGGGEKPVIFLLSTIFILLLCTFSFGRLYNVIFFIFLLTLLIAFT